HYKVYNVDIDFLRGLKFPSWLDQGIVFAFQQGIGSRVLSNCTNAVVNLTQGLIRLLYVDFRWHWFSGRFRLGFGLGLRFGLRRGQRNSFPEVGLVDACYQFSSFISNGIVGPNVGEYRASRVPHEEASKRHGSTKN